MDLRHVLYVKDGRGSTCKMAVSIYEGKILHHFELAKHFKANIESLKTAKPREDDVWIVTFPRSGTHWIHEIVGILQSGKLEHLKYFKNDSNFDIKPFNEHINKPSPRILCTHFRPKYFPAGTLEQEKVIYVLRNPKSAIVSFYFLMTGSTGRDYEGTFEGFYDWCKQGLDDLIGSWFEHVTEWWDVMKKRQNILLVCYEDLIKEPVKNIMNIAKFLGLDRDIDFCTEVAKLVSFDVMKSNKNKSEDTLQYQNSLWKDGQSKFIRKGKIDDWKNYFNHEMNADFDQLYEEKMKNYPEITEMIQYE